MSLSPRSSTSRFAILGVLGLGAMSGYDVKKLIERSIAHFWNESYGQIYPILNRLAAEGSAERRSETQRGKPDRHVYSLTPKGREELARWLAVPARHEPFRSELLLKLFLGEAGRVADAIAQIEHYEASQRELLETYVA
ncbi:MAG: PadR family transcriptional regulator, partial [Candidatus Rokuibacteriota bacterium]